MLFSLFFGAGNLIFPAFLGQREATDVFSATLGFLLTGTGLPLLGVAAMGFSQEKDVRTLAARVHPIYGLFFTMMLYLTIGPFFALPRTATVAFEIGVVPIMGADITTVQPLYLAAFTVVFFALSLWISLAPGKLVERIGKILTPALLISILILSLYAVFQPMSALPQGTNDSAKQALMAGFIDGYNTMDALASMIFGVFVIQAIDNGQSKAQLMKLTFYAGGIAAICLAVTYSFIAYIGATSVGLFGILDNGAAVLAHTAQHYFGKAGNLLMAVIVFLACLSTSVGLICACADFFHRLIPKFSYKVWVWIFSIFAAAVANYGLKALITYSIPVLMWLYPLMITLILLTFLSPIFAHQRWVYRWTIGVTAVIGFFDAYKAAFGLSDATLALLSKYLPMYEIGLGWLIPVILIIGVGILCRLFRRPKVLTSI